RNERAMHPVSVALRAALDLAPDALRVVTHHRNVDRAVVVDHLRTRRSSSGGRLAKCRAGGARRRNARRRLEPRERDLETARNVAERLARLLRRLAHRFERVVKLNVADLVSRLA